MKHTGIVPVLGEFTPKDGEPYRPSNGTEGEFFEERWCAHCKCDAGFRNGWDDVSDQPTEEGCQILAAALACGIRDKGYPIEWQWQKGEPVCVAFDDEEVTITNEERAAQLPLIA